MKETRSPCHLLSKYQRSPSEQHLCRERQQPRWKACPAPPGAGSTSRSISSRHLRMGLVLVVEPGRFLCGSKEELRCLEPALPAEPHGVQEACFVGFWVSCHFCAGHALPHQLPGGREGKCVCSALLTLVPPRNCTYFIRNIY